MTTVKKVFCSVFTIFILAVSFSFGVYAKDLEVCYHCGGTGAYHCEKCGNTGFVTCDGCGGAGKWVCPGEDGRGKCDSGHYVCPSCHGDTYIRNGDGEIPPDAQPGTCGACSGKGRLECIRCHGTGAENCDRCGGSGKDECHNGKCEIAKSMGWKCPDCSGTGYILTGNPMPPASYNDGIRNVPAVGDKIWKDGKSVTYTQNGSGGSDGSGQSGGSSGGGQSGGQEAGTKTQIYDSNRANIPRDPATGRDLIWYVDAGTGEWEIGGHVVTLTRNGSRASGVLDLKYYENVGLVGLPDVPGLTVDLVCGDGTKLPLILTGNGEFAVGRHIPEEAAVPFRVSLAIEAPPEETRGADGVTEAPEETEKAPETVETERQERGETEVQIPGVPGASVRFDTERMTEEERGRYSGMTDGELEGLADGLRGAIGSARTGESGDDLKEKLDAIARSVGFKDSEDGGLFLIDFGEGFGIGFPVRIKIPLEKGALDGGSDLFVYRLTEDGFVPLGKADYFTYPDGSVEAFSFYSDAVSDLFVCRFEFAEDLSEITGTPEENSGEKTGGIPLVPIVAVSAAAVAAGAVIIIKKKRSDGEGK